VTVGLVFVLAAWLTVTSVSFLSSQSLLSESSTRIRTLQQANADLAFDVQLRAAEHLERIGALESQAERQEATIAELASAKAALRGELEAREGELARVSEQRDQARGLLAEMRRAKAEAEQLLAVATAERALLRRQLRAAQEKVVEIGDQRDAGRRLEGGLRWRLAGLEERVARLLRHRESAQLWLKDWVVGSVAALEEVFDQAGINVDQLIARAGNAPAAGQGGPLEVARDEIGSAAGAPAADPMRGDIQRLAQLQRIARTLPLAAPLDQFHVTSPFGKRRDPFTGTWAYHSGLDLGAPRDAKVLAPAPGRVISAGRSGPYGNMVEIDHGMGIVTRYAHLKSIDVAVGDEIQFREVIGVPGNTGRSTSRHLHYEIQIDQRPSDPTRFLDAGRQMVGVLDVAEREKME
jgi:murein DD-endopeptidase MepM/ murein hydrolase activator NlpD